VPTVGIFDQAKNLAGEHADDIAKGVDQAAELIKSKTPDSVDGKVEQVAEAIEGAVHKLA
jgi:MT0933-like antitoxin protein